MNLLQKTLNSTNLRRAWDDVADNGGIAGADNITIPQWRRGWEARLVNLSQAVRSNRYKPGPLRLRRIPKRHAPEMRLLRIPTLADRILQRAVLQQLYPICEPRFFECSFGYRPGRGVKDAVRHITHLRKKGYRWVLDADIDDFFNQIDHQLLRQHLQHRLPDTSLLRLIDLWLESWRIAPEQEKGIAMGSPLSPLLANIHLHHLDSWILNHGFELVRYADDFIVLSQSRSEWQRSYQVTKYALSRLKLRYEPRKTRLTSFAKGFAFLGVHFEEGWYWYLWDDQRIEVRGDEADPWLETYDPNY